MSSIISDIEVKRFFECLKEKGLSNEDIAAMAKRSGERNLTDEDVLIIEEVKSQLIRKEGKDGRNGFFE